MPGPSILFFDIETAPIEGHVWGLRDQNININQIKKDWFVLSWAAKWADEKHIMYADQSKAKHLENDKRILKKMWALLDKADVVITQNGINFDVKKLYTRFIIHGLKPPSPFKHIDILRIAKKYFKFTSNKLEYMASILNTKHKKLTDSRRFSGFNLWRECLKRNKAAWLEMRRYNIRDVLVLEEVYKKVVVWDSRAPNFNIYHDGVNRCKCGCSKFEKRGFHVTAIGKYQIYRCTECGARATDTKNLININRRKQLLRGF